MTAPALAAGRFLSCCGIGLLLGLSYGFLRPLRRKRAWFADLIFVLLCFWGWLEAFFGISRGESGLPVALGLLLGAILEEWTLGKWLRPVFSTFWRLFFLPLGKFFTFFRNICKKLFAIWKKWVTIGWNICWHSAQRSGGVPHGKKARQAGISQQAHYYDHRAGGRDLLHRGSGGAAKRTERKQKSACPDASAGR